MDDVTIIAGIVIPSTSRLFLAAVGLHVLFGLACTVSGLIAMLSGKGRGRHSTFGSIYYWCLLVVFISAAGLSAARWDDDYHLFLLGLAAFAAAYLGRRALRRRWQHWARLHVAGMGASYVLLLTAFYVDNGKDLPLWRELPHLAFWFLPSVVGVPIIVYVLTRHPFVRRLESRDAT